MIHIISIATDDEIIHIGDDINIYHSGNYLNWLEETTISAHIFCQFLVS